MAFAPCAADAQESRLLITILEADGAINNIRSARIHDPVVRVTDRSGQPVPDATVTFILPPSGPGAIFTDGDRTRIVKTDEDGKAVATGLRPNKNVGDFQIRVLASSDGSTARAFVNMTNVDPNGEPKSRRTLIIVAAIAGAAAAGALAAASGGSSASAPVAAPVVTPPPGNSITPGTPNVGPPR